MLTSYVKFIYIWILCSPLIIEREMTLYREKDSPLTLNSWEWKGFRGLPLSFLIIGGEQDFGKHVGSVSQMRMRSCPIKNLKANSWENHFTVIIGVALEVGTDCTDLDKAKASEILLPISFISLSSFAWCLWLKMFLFVEPQAGNCKCKISLSRSWCSVFDCP